MNQTTNEKIPAFAILNSIYNELDDIVNPKDTSVLSIPVARIPLWIAGGALSDLARGKMFKDVDIFTSMPDAVLAAFKEADIHPYFHVAGRVSNFRILGHAVQIVTGYSPTTPHDIIDMFDFTAVCGVYDTETFICHPRFWQDNSTMRLVINNLPKPLSTLERITKYCRKGFRCCPIGLARVARTINEMDINWDEPKENEIQFYPDGTPRFLGVD